jgi:hypothetical protein
METVMSQEQMAGWSFMRWFGMQHEYNMLCLRIERLLPAQLDSTGKCRLGSVQVQKPIQCYQAGASLPGSITARFSHA